MPGTVVDDLRDATAALNNAAAVYQGRADQVAANLAATTGKTATIIQQFLSRPPTYTQFVDALNGADTNDGLSMDAPVKNIDTAFSRLSRDAANFVFLLSDVTIKQYWFFYSPVTIEGIQRGNGSAGAAYSNVLRRVTFASEAENSPYVGIGRTVAGFAVRSPTFRASHCEMMLGDPAGGIDQKHHIFLTGSTFQFASGIINVPRAATLAFLVAYVSGAKSSMWFSGSSYDNARGHIVIGVAANGDPNSTYAFETNLPTA